MTTYDENQLDKLLRRRITIEQRQINPPPQLRTDAIAKKYACQFKK